MHPLTISADYVRSRASVGALLLLTVAGCNARDAVISYPGWRYDSVGYRNSVTYDFRDADEITFLGTCDLSQSICSREGCRSARWKSPPMVGHGTSSPLKANTAEAFSSKTLQSWIRSAMQGPSSFSGQAIGNVGSSQPLCCTGSSPNAERGGKSIPKLIAGSIALNRQSEHVRMPIADLLLLP
jgi:hypothetical protein